MNINVSNLSELSAFLANSQCPSSSPKTLLETCSSYVWNLVSKEAESSCIKTNYYDPTAIKTLQPIINRFLENFKTNWVLPSTNTLNLEGQNGNVVSHLRCWSTLNNPSNDLQPGIPYPFEENGENLQIIKRASNVCSLTRDKIVYQVDAHPTETNYFFSHDNQSPILSKNDISDYFFSNKNYQELSYYEQHKGKAILIGSLSLTFLCGYKAISELSNLWTKITENKKRLSVTSKDKDLSLDKKKLEDEISISKKRLLIYSVATLGFGVFSAFNYFTNPSFISYQTTQGRTVYFKP